MSGRYFVCAERFFVDSRYNELGITAPYLEMGSTSLESPSRLNAERSTLVPYEEIHSIVHVEWGRLDCMVVGANRRFPLLIRRKDLVGGPLISRLVADLKQHVANSPGGSQRLSDIEQRELFLRRLVRPPWLVLLFVGVLGLLHYLVESRVVSQNSLSGTHYFGTAVPALIDAGQIYRLVTAGFLHASLSHLVINSAGLVLFGWVVEAALGAKRIALLLLVANVAGSTTWWVSLDPFDFSNGYGSSAAMWGVFGATAVLATLRRTDFPVGFRSVVLLWLIIAQQVTANLNSPAVVPHFAGGVSGAVIVAWWTRGQRRAPLSDSRSLGKLLCLAAISVVLAFGMAVHSEFVNGQEDVIDLMYERLGDLETPDHELNETSRTLAVMDPVSKEVLNRAVDRMAALIDRDPVPAYRDTLATLRYRLGDTRQAVEIMRELWRDDPTPWYATQLTRFYAADLGDRSTRPEVNRGKAKHGLEQVDVQLIGPTGRYGPSLLVALGDLSERTTAIHALIFEGKELRGFAEATVPPVGTGVTCEFIAGSSIELNFNEISVQPVWFQEIDAIGLPNEASCGIHWVLDGVMDIP